MASTEPCPEGDRIGNLETLLKELEKEVDNLYKFRDLFFEHHEIEMASEKNRLVEQKMNLLTDKFKDIDENEIPMSLRPQFLYTKGRTYNITSTYDPRASQCLSKAVKLNPRMVDAWNELGECYWKNLNIKDAKSSFEGALKQERNKVALRCLSIILRQEATHSTLSPAQHQEAVLKSVELAREAVNKDATDGNCWSVLGNAQLCRYFLISQQPETLKAAMSAYKQAARDPITRGMPDLYYNSGVGLKYDEQYSEALTNFELACRLDPSWDVPIQEKKKLLDYLAKVHNLVNTKGKLKTKKIQAMVQAIDQRHIGPYAALQSCTLADLRDGENPKTMLIGKVVGSVHCDNLVPFTFALVDASLSCAAVTVYNWADGRGATIGDTVTLPQPTVHACHVAHGDTEYRYRSIRVNNPMTLLVNGKKIGRNQIAGTRVTSTYEIH